jgi:hypothetical protein
MSFVPKTALLIDPQRLSINDPHDMQIETLWLGNGRYPVLVVDNFYRDPDHVREIALGLNYLPPTGKHPGYLAMLSLSMESILSFLHRRFADFYFPTLESLQQQAHPWAFFRCEPPGSRPPRPVSQRPHVDDALLAGVLYLNLPERCRGGTGFYRHVETGAEAVIPKDVMAGRSPYANLDEAVVTKMKEQGACDAFLRWKQDNEGPAKGYDTYASSILDTPGSTGEFISDSAGGWEMTRMLAMKYNRLIVYPGFLLHSACHRPEWFGEEAASSRLTQNFFFAWPKQQDAEAS